MDVSKKHDTSNKGYCAEDNLNVKMRQIGNGSELRKNHFVAKRVSIVWIGFSLRIFSYYVYYIYNIK